MTAVKSAYPSSEEPLPYNRPFLITGSQGSVSQPSPKGYLSICPYIRTHSLLEELNASILTIKNGVRFSS